MRLPEKNDFWTEGDSNSFPLLSSRPLGPQEKGNNGNICVFCLILFPGGWQGIWDWFHFLCELLKVI